MGQFFISILKRWIMKKNYRRKHAKPAEVSVMKKHLTPWQVFLKEHGQTEGIFTLHFPICKYNYNYCSWKASHGKWKWLIYKICK